jgi:DNA-directed RNA polymerase specialized sigma24 family protein
LTLADYPEKDREPPWRLCVPDYQGLRELSLEQTLSKAGVSRPVKIPAMQALFARHRTYVYRWLLRFVRDATLAEEDRDELLRRALMRLSSEHRQIIDLVYYHEKSVDEVAHILDLPPATVKTRMFHARKKNWPRW